MLAETDRPLDGILVVDFSQFLAGPVAAMRLADHLMSCHIAQGVTALLVRRFRTGEGAAPRRACSRRCSTFSSNFSARSSTTRP